MNWESTLSLLGKKFADTFKRCPVLSAPDMPESAEAFLVLSAGATLGKTIIWVAGGDKSLETNHGNLLALCRDTTAAGRILYYPAWETLPRPAGMEDPETCGDRSMAQGYVSAKPHYGRFHIQRVR